jgi:hypothetical protein
VHKIDLSTLPYAKGASWNSDSVCLLETRKALLEDIWDWISSADSAKSAEILWLTAVAGAGKSAIAHTVAQRCHEKGLLASSFFFDRETAGRNTPQKLFSTIARDIANLNNDLAQQIGLVIEGDQSIATASPSRQFKELILDHCRRLPVQKPIVIIVDAVDEGYNPELLRILRDQVPKLSGTFRFIITSRPDKNIIPYLSNKVHILSRTINIHEQPNLDDIAVYVRYRLNEIAELADMGHHWPGQKLSDEFMRKAEGLFIWVSTVCDYLCLNVIDPTAGLESLISGKSPTGLPAEAKMDSLYSSIMKTCNWQEKAFVEGYHLLMGAIMAAKTPLSSSALQSLYRTSLTLPVGKVLQPLGSLLTGLAEKSGAVCILHLSFRDFLTVRALSILDCEQFYICDKDHSGRLALLCLVVLNQDLNPDIPGTGYLTVPGSDSSTIPEVDHSHISEELWYACCFWIDHLVDLGDPEQELLDMLQSFLSTKVVLWMEVTSSHGQFQKLLRVQMWLQVCYSTKSVLIVV